ncbi:putative holin-like toxin [Lactobacillus ultunensis]
MLLFGMFLLALLIYIDQHKK